MFNHVNLNLPKLSRKTVDGVRYYQVEDGGEMLDLVSITSVTSHRNRAKFAKWRKKVGDKEADRITKAATSRGTDMHTLTEYYLKNLSLVDDHLKIYRHGLVSINRRYIWLKPIYLIRRLQ